MLENSTTEWTVNQIPAKLGPASRFIIKVKQKPLISKLNSRRSKKWMVRGQSIQPQSEFWSEYWSQYQCQYWSKYQSNIEYHRSKYQILFHHFRVIIWIFICVIWLHKSYMASKSNYYSTLNHKCWKTWIVRVYLLPFDK